VPHLLTGEVVPAVPFAFDALLGAATMVLFLAAIICYGLREAWGHTIGHGLRWLANEIEDVGISLGWFGSIHPFGFLASALRSVDHVVAHALAVAALNTENAATTMWHMTASVFWWTVHETKSLAVDTFHAIEHAVTVTVPDAAKWARREAVSEAHRLVHREAALRRAADAELRHLAHVADADALHGIRAAEHALDWSEAEVGHIGREINGLRARLRAIERALSPAAIVALIGATIFKTFDLGWLRCSNVGRMGRFLCGLPLGLLEDLFAVEIIALVASDICDFANSVETIALRFQGALFALVDVENALVGCHGADAPPDLSLPPDHLPPTNLGLHLAA
jgi:hypothetical protein